MIFPTNWIVSESISNDFDARATKVEILFPMTRSFTGADSEDEALYIFGGHTNELQVSDSLIMSDIRLTEKETNYESDS